MATLPGSPFFLSLLVAGALTGAIYALIALAFVLVYKSSRMVNFALGEWITSGALIAGVGWQALGLGLVGGILLALVAMAAIGTAFNRLVVRHLAMRPAISLIIVTIGLGMLLRGISSILFAGVPAGFPIPIAAERLAIEGIPVPPDRLLAASIAAAVVALVTAFYRHSRTGLALRAIADDAQAASAAGIDIHRHFALLWAITGAISVIAGILWVMVVGGGFGVALVGLKIFPIVIIGGLDSLPGTIVAAMMIGVLESLGTGYLDPLVGGGFGAVSSYLLLLAMLLLRPHGLFGRQPALRV